MPSIRIIAAIASLAALIGVATAPAASAGPLTRPDRISVAGFHFQTLHPADVIAGSTSNNLMLHYKAGRAISDGTLRISFPLADWPTPLQPKDGGLYGPGSGRGQFSVRPWDTAVAPDPRVVPQPACASPEDGSTSPLALESDAGQQVVIVRHVNCAAGQSLTVLVQDIAAPAQVGRYFLTVEMSEPSDPTRQSISLVHIDVRPAPKIQLVVGPVPNQVPAGQGFPVRVTALRPNGHVARNYRGEIAVVTMPDDCTVTPRDQIIAHQFTAADAGVTYIDVAVWNLFIHQLVVFDVGNKAKPGLSSPFDVVPGADGGICPTSYH